MATKTLNTRITLKADTTANWSSSTLVLLKGEMAIEIPESGEYKMKIGDGVNTFSKLSYVAMTPTEIKNLINSGAIQTVSLSTGTNNGTIAITVDGVKTDNIAVKGLGSAAYTNSNAYAAAGHGHAISGITGLQTALDGKSATGHTHDDRYYTESEMNTKLAGKANSSHSHGAGDITSVNASAIQGVIGLDHLPAGALERCKVVKDDTARFALTTAAVQTGDTVKVTDTGKMYFITDDSKLDTEAGYEVYTAGSATSVPWSGVTGKPSTFTPSSHSHAIADVTNLQNTLNGKATSAQGAKADSAVQSVKIGSTEYKSGTTVTLPAYPTSLPASDVPAWAKAPTKPTYTKAEVGLGNVDNTADSAKSVKYAASAGAVTWENVSGKPSTYTPSSHTHTIDNITGLQSALDGKASSGHTHNSFSGETHFSTGTYTDPANGITTAIKASGGIASDVFYEGTTKLSDKYQPKGSYAAASHTHTIAQITNLQSTLDGKSNNGHTHNYAGSTSSGGAANSAVKLSNSRNFSITGGATAAAVGFDGTGAVSLNVTSVSTDVLNNGSNTLILSCGGAS